MSNATVTTEVRDVLKESRIDGNRLFLPDRQLPRPLYEAVNKVLVNSGGKWNRTAKAHVFAADPRTKLDLALDTGVSVDEKKRDAFFATPPELAKRLVEMADVRGLTVLEPSAGEGALVWECRAQGARHIDCVELSPERVGKLRTLALSVFVNCVEFPSERIGTLSAANDHMVVRTGDFLALDNRVESGLRAPYHRVVMNPPFLRSTWVKHIEHALKFLALNGRLVSVIPNSNPKPFTALLARLSRNGLRHEIHDVGGSVFAESGTKVKVKILEVY